MENNIRCLDQGRNVESTRGGGSCLEVAYHQVICVASCLHAACPATRICITEEGTGKATAFMVRQHATFLLEIRQITIPFSEADLLCICIHLTCQTMHLHFNTFSTTLPRVPPRSICFPVLQQVSALSFPLDSKISFSQLHIKCFFF